MVVTLFLEERTEEVFCFGESVFLLREGADSSCSSLLVLTLIISTLDLSELARSKTEGGAASNVGCEEVFVWMEFDIWDLILSA
jgi:hypothetical protein